MGPGAGAEPTPDWEPWLTAEQGRLADDRQELLDELEAFAADYRKRDEVIRAKQDVAKENAATGLGRLLTEDRDELKNAVADALARLGFEVTDADARFVPPWLKPCTSYPSICGSP